MNQITFHIGTNYKIHIYGYNNSRSHSQIIQVHIQLSNKMMTRAINKIYKPKILLMRRVVPIYIKKKTNVIFYFIIQS